MPVSHIGDLSRNYVTRLQSTQLKTQLNKLTQEVGTGITANKTQHLRGHLTPLVALERSLEILQSHERAGQEAKILADAKQNILSNVQEVGAKFATSLLPAAQSQQHSAFAINAQDAATHLQSIISDLNTSVGGRSLFSGADVANAALASADTMLADIRLAAAGSSTIADFLTAIDAWFFTGGGGFETNGYIGATDDIAPVVIGNGQTADLTQRADDMSLRNVMRNFAVAALSTDASFGFNAAELRSITITASEDLHASIEDLTGVRAALGTAQHRIDNALAQNSAEKTAQSITRNALIALDPFETATELQNVQFQIEAIYTITARLSRLSLAEFLR